MSEEEKENMQAEEASAETSAEADNIEPQESVQTEVDQPVDLLEEIRRQNKITWKDVTKHLGGPLISIAIHIVILILAGTLIMAEAPKPPPPEVQVEMKEVDPVPPPPPPENEVEIEEVTDVTAFTEVTDRPAVKMETIQTSVDTSAPTSTSMEDVVIEAPVTAEVSPSKLKLKGLYQARSGSGRKLALKKYGATRQDTERSVTRALKWFVSVQNEDGTWGDVEDPLGQKQTLTCLVLLAFLAHGETTLSPDGIGLAMEKGLRKVTEWAGRNNDLYAQARIGIVLSEGYAITRIPMLERAMNKCINNLVRRQNEIGGWYGWYDHREKKNKPGSDLKVGSRIYNALYSAYAAGSNVKGLKDAIDKCVSAIEKYHVTQDGGFTFGMAQGKGKADFEATNAGILYLFLMSSRKSSVGNRALHWVENFKINDKKGSELKMDFKNLPTQTSALAWYYETQALFQAYQGEGKNWRKWNDSFATVLVREQDQKGYWLCPADKYPIIEEKVIGKKKYKIQKVYNESELGGYSELNAKIWATCYFTLSLEVYYRYLPTFKSQTTDSVIEDDNDLAL